MTETCTLTQERIFGGAAASRASPACTSKPRFQARDLRGAFGLALVGAALLAVRVHAQEPAPPAGAGTDPQTEVIDQVIVRGRRLSEVEADLRIEIGKFLGEIAAPA